MMSSASSISTNSLTPYTTTTDVPHGLNIEIIWDSSVANAPPGFIPDVEQVANFYASELKPISTGPIIIDVGYGDQNRTTSYHRVKSSTCAHSIDVTFAPDTDTSRQRPTRITVAVPRQVRTKGGGIGSRESHHLGNQQAERLVLGHDRHWLWGTSANQWGFLLH
jgi:hypothetical protein